MELFVFASSPWSRAVVESALRSARPYPTLRVTWVRLRQPGTPAWKVWARDARDRAWVARFGRRHRAIGVTALDDEALLRAIGTSAHGVIAGFSKIFPASLIERFQSLINLHPSLLPYYRGPVPSTWVLREGERWTGLSAHRVTPRIDQGEVLFQSLVPVETGDTPDVLDRRIAAVAAAWLPLWVIHLAQNTPWNATTVDVDRYVTQKVGYRSFPDRG